MAAGLPGPICCHGVSAHRYHIVKTVACLITGTLPINELRIHWANVRHDLPSKGAGMPPPMAHGRLLPCPPRVRRITALTRPPAGGLPPRGRASHERDDDRRRVLRGVEHPEGVDSPMAPVSSQSFLTTQGPLGHGIPGAHPVKASEAAGVSIPALTVTGSVRRLDGVQFGVPALPGIKAWAFTL